MSEGDAARIGARPAGGAIEAGTTTGAEAIAAPPETGPSAPDTRSDGSLARMGPGVGSLSNQFTAAAMAALVGQTAVGRRGAVGEQAALQEARSKVAEALSGLAAKDPKALEAILRQALGDKLDDRTLGTWLGKIAKGDLPWPDTIRFVDPKVLLGANAAYSKEDGGTIYVSRSLIDRPRALEQALAEELGHHLDQLAGGKDSRGDEGEIFAKGLLKGAPLDEAELARARADRDQGTVEIDGKPVRVEFQQTLSTFDAQAALELFTSAMTSGFMDPVSDANVQEAFDAIQWLAAKEQAEVLQALLTREPDKVARFFAEMEHPPRPEVAKAIAGWFSDPKMPVELKRAFMKNLKGDAFATLMSGIKNLPEEERKDAMAGLINGIGPDRWTSKLKLEQLRGFAEGGDDASEGVAAAIEMTTWIAEKGADLLDAALPPGFGDLMEVYAAAVRACSTGMRRTIVNGLEDTSFRASASQLQGAFAKAGIRDVQKFLDTLKEIQSAIHR